MIEMIYEYETCFLPSVFDISVTEFGFLASGRVANTTGALTTNVPTSVPMRYLKIAKQG